jgi:hypothetical protein
MKKILRKVKNGLGELMNKLYFNIGDRVMSRWGEAKIVRMDITSFGEPKYGDSVSNVPIDYNGPWVADLDNGHWAYGSQISLIEGHNQYA